MRKIGYGKVNNYPGSQIKVSFTFKVGVFSGGKVVTPGLLNSFL
jgi:hypothetical protein